MSEADELKLPSGWTLTPVGDLLKFKNGLNKGKAYFGYGTPIVNYMDVFKHAGLRRADVDGLVNVTNAEKQAFSARKGDVLFTRTSETPEEVGISTVLLEEIEDAVFSGFVLRGRPVNDRLTSEFAQYCFDSRFVRGQIISSATYTTRALTNGRILSNVKMPLPDDPGEQQAIAAALSDADGVVAGLERVIAKKRLIKQGAMQDLLTARRRLPGFSGEWAKVQLKDYTSHGSGNSGLIKGTLQRSGRVGDYPAFTASGPDLMLDFFEQEGDAIIISAVGSRCGKSFRARGKWSAIANTHVLRCREGLDVDFAFIFMNDEDFWLKGGTGQPFVLVRRTLERPLLLPPVNEQQAIASVLRDMDAEIQTLESRLAKARAVKEGMMQNLLTGRVRLV